MPEQSSASARGPVSAGPIASAEIRSGCPPRADRSLSLQGPSLSGPRTRNIDTLRKALEHRQRTEHPNSILHSPCQCQQAGIACGFTVKKTQWVTAGTRSQRQRKHGMGTGNSHIARTTQRNVLRARTRTYIKPAHPSPCHPPPIAPRHVHRAWSDPHGAERFEHR